MTLQKTTIFRFFTQSGRLLTQFLVILGCQRAPAEDIFAYFFGCLFRLGFPTILLSKNAKNEKWKKLVSIYNLQCFVRVAMSRKMQGRLQKNYEKKHRFFAQKSTKKQEKVGCGGLPSKNRQKDCHVTLIFRKSLFLVDFGVPGGTPKWVKWGDDP